MITRTFIPGLTLLLIGLKLTHQIDDVSWWWVWSPMLAIPAVCVGVFAVAFIYLMLESPQAQRQRLLRATLKKHEQGK